MKKLTTSVLAIVLSSTFVVANAQQTKDTVTTKNIEEVVITGALGIKRKADAVTNAQQVVGAKELTQASATNAVTSLTGKVSGLTITNTNSSVDGNYRIVLRGIKSLTGNNQALIVIDNVISSANILGQLPAEVIESVNVIKGLQGAALYGQQGVNGVIIVTTKRGTNSEKIQFTLTSSIESSSVYKLPQVQTKYGKGVQDQSFSNVDYNGTNYVPWENTSWGPAFNDPTIGGTLVPSGLPQQDGSLIYERYAPVKDHFSKFFTNGLIFQNGVSMNVGGRDSYAFFSVNRLENEFVVEGDKLKRNSFLAKAGKKFGKLRVDVQANYISKIVNQTSAGLYDDLLQLPTTNDVRKYRNSEIPGYATLYAQNPYWTIKNERNDNVTDYLSGIIALNYEFNKHININYTGNIRLNNQFVENHNNGFDPTTYTYQNTGIPYLDGAVLDDISSSSVVAYYFNHKYSSRNFYGDLSINFDYDLSSDINFKLNLGNNIQDNYATAASVGGTGLQIPNIYNISNVQNLSSLTGGTQLDGYGMDNYVSRTRSIAGFANLDLSYKDYLFLNGTFRLEESSTLSTYINGERRNKVYPYYSAGLSFIPTKAFKGLGDSFLNYVKIAPSYTRVGNSSAIGAYATTPISVIPGGFPFNVPSYINDTQPTSLDVQPEFVDTADLNVVFGMFKDRIRIEGSIYQSDTDGLITNRSVSNASGLLRLQGNIGKLRLRGYEVELGLVPIRTSSVVWDLRANISASKSEVLSLDTGIDNTPIGSVLTRPAAGIYAVVGGEAQTIRGTAYTRDDQGRIIVNSRGQAIVSNVFQDLGKVNPDYILGLNTSLKVKGFTFSATMDYRHGGHFISLTKNLLAFTGGLQETADFDRSKGYIIPNSVVNTAPVGQTPVYVENTVAIGSADYSGVTNYFAGSTFRAIGETSVVSSDAFKIREVALSYDLPRSVLGGTFVNSMSFGVFAKNPYASYAKDNQNFADPESANTTGNGAGIALTGQYPTTRSFGFNLKATF